MKNLIFLVIFAVLVSNVFVSAENSFLSLGKKVQAPSASCSEGTSLCGGAVCCAEGKCCHGKIYDLHSYDYYYCCE